MSGQLSLPDAELQQLLVQDDYQAFTILYNRFIPGIRGFLLKILKSADLSSDVAQEVFAKIWSNRKQLAEVKVFKAYLFVTARNHALNSLKISFRSEEVTAEIFYRFIAERNTTEDELLTKEYQSFLKRILDSLPKRSCEIFSLCREQGKSYEEAAVALGVSRNAVKNHMVYSMKVLRNATEKELGISLSIVLAMLFKI